MFQELVASFQSVSSHSDNHIASKIENATKKLSEFQLNIELQQSMKKFKDVNNSSNKNKISVVVSSNHMEKKGKVDHNIKKSNINRGKGKNKNKK